MANSILLTQDENGSGGRSDTFPEVWFADKPESYLDTHPILRDRGLWGIERFEEFSEEGKRLIRFKFVYLLSQKLEGMV